MVTGVETGKVEVFVVTEFTCGADVVTGVLKEAPTAISHLCPGRPCAGFIPALAETEFPDIVVVVAVGKLLVKAGRTIDVSDNNVSAMVKGVTGFVEVAGERLSSVAFVSLPEQATKKTEAKIQAETNIFFIHLGFIVRLKTQFTDLYRNFLTGHHLGGW